MVILEPAWPPIATFQSQKMSDEDKFSQIACDCRLAYGFVSNLSFFNKIHQYDINKNVFNEAGNSELNQGNATGKVQVGKIRFLRNF